MTERKTPFYKGDFRNDAIDGNHRNWFVGKFLEEEPRKTEHLEIKYWAYGKGESVNHPIKISCTIECTLILKGQITGTVAGRDVKLSSGEYVVISPGTPNGLPQQVLEDVQGLTIKAPCIPEAKHEIAELKKDGSIWFKVESLDPR